MFIATADAIYSLGHRLRTFTAVPRSTQPSTLSGTVQFRGSDVNAPLDSADNDRRWIDLYVCVITGLDLPTHGAEAVLKPNAHSEFPSECQLHTTCIATDFKPQKQFTGTDDVRMTGFKLIQFVLSP